MGDGHSIKIYYDLWLPSRNPSSITSPHVLSVDASVCRLISTGGIWNLDLLSHCFNEDEVALILSIPLPDSPVKDLLIWHFSQKGFYTIKSGYWVAQSIQNRQVGDEGPSVVSEDVLWRCLWTLTIPNRVKLFLWRCFHLILPCNQTLFQRHIIPSPLCGRCGKKSKFVMHAIWSCRSSKVVWSLTHFHSLFSSWKNGGFDDFFRSSISILSKTELSYLAYVCWGIWLARNDFIFNNKCLPAVLIIEKAQLLMEEFVKVNTGSRSSFARSIMLNSNHSASVHWRKPSFPFVKVNVDGAVNVAAGTRGLGVVVKHV